MRKNADPSGKILCIDVGGTRTKIGVFESADKCKEKTVDTRDLFSDVDMAYERIKSTIENKYEVDLESFDSLSIAVPGAVDESRGAILNSVILNSMARKKYNGFNFKECFGGDIGEENVFVLNDAKAAALGCIYSFPEMECPSLVITLGTGCGTCLIHSVSINSVEPVEWGIEKINSRSQGNVDLHSFLGNKAIELSRSQKWAGNINEFYTDRALRALKLLKDKYERKFPGKIKSAVILGGKIEYINRKSLKMAGVEIIVPDEEKQKKIPLLGCLTFAMAEHGRPVKSEPPRKYRSKYKTNLPLSVLFNCMLGKCTNRSDIGRQPGFDSIEFHSGDGCLLKGWTYRTPGKGNDRGTCIICHGFCDNSSSLMKPAQILSCKYGLTVLSFDHRHHGWSERRYPTFGCYEAYDVQAAMDYADRRKFPKPYILHGTSLGGMACQRAGIEDPRAAGLFLLSTPAWPWDAIGKCAQIATPLANFISLAYGWDVLNGGDIRKCKQSQSHIPLVCYIMGDKDRYDINLTEKIFKYWHNGEQGEYEKLPSELPLCRKFFYKVKGAIHPEGKGYMVWDWDRFKEVERDFFATVLKQCQN